MNLTKKSLKILSAIMTCFVVMFSFQLNAEESVYDGMQKASVASNAGAAQDGYKFISGNEKLEFYLNEKTGGFYVFSKTDGKKWYSTPQDVNLDDISKGKLKHQTQSELFLEYIRAEDENINSVTQMGSTFVDVLNNGSLTVEPIKNGVKVIYDFKQLDFIIPVKYVLKKDHLEASVLVSEIDEGNKNLLISIGFLPYFGAASPTDSGYIFVPDGSGAIAKFNSNIIPKTNYDKSIYGDDVAYVDEANESKSENILFPVFGTVYDTGSALMGIVTSGDAGASISVIIGSDKYYYNTISSKIMYRIYQRGESLFTNNKSNEISTLTHIPFGVDNYTVRYYTLSGDAANYSGMANVYRNYLVNEYNLKKNEYQPALSIDVYGALKTKANFLGISYNKNRKLTSFEDTEKIVDYFKEKGIEKVSLRYIGWQNDGVFNVKMPNKAKPMSILGGKKDFISLRDKMNEYGYDFYPSVDLITYQKGGNGIFKRGDSAKSPSGNIALQNHLSIATFEPLTDVKPWALLTPSKLIDVSEKYLKSYKKLEIDSISLDDIGDYIYSDFDKRDGVNRAKNANYISQAVKSIKGKISNVAVTGGNIYAAKYADRIISLPLSSSGYDIFSYDVPFVQMVLHGYVAYTTPYMQQSADSQTTFLKAIETGSDLLYSCVSDDTYPLRETRLAELFSSEFSLWRNDAIELYEKQQKVSELIKNSEIKSHSRIATDVFETVYSNDVAVYVNYSDVQITVDGITVDSLDFVVKGEER